MKNSNSSIQERRNYYLEHGYVVVQNVVKPTDCDQALHEFNNEVRPFTGRIYRQTTANPEKHTLDSFGRITNPILNPLSVNPHKFKNFRNISSKILSSNTIFELVESIFLTEASLVQSMYFESCAGTWAHQDTYYLDSEVIGSMVGAWIALEDISEGAGRFFVGVDSHKIDMVKNGGNFDIAFNHDRYKDLVNKIIDEKSIKIIAPKLNKGDVLLWNSKTIHGSHPATDRSTRHSLTAHFIPRNHKFMQLQSISKHLPYTIINGHACYLAKDQKKGLNRAILHIESTFPRSIQKLKKIAVKLATSN